MGSRAGAVLLAAALLSAATGMRCGGGGPTVRIDVPLDPALLAGGATALSAVTGAGFQTASITVELDGVDLVAALGLVPPFSGQGGAVLLPGGPATVADFAIQQGSPASLNRIDADVAGLAAGPHTLVVTALNAQSVLASDQADFEVVEAFGQAAAALSSAPAPPSFFPLTPIPVANASLGEAAASPPIGTAAGDTVRSGFVEAAEQRIGGP